MLECERPSWPGFCRIVVLRWAVFCARLAFDPLDIGPPQAAVSPGAGRPPGADTRGEGFPARAAGRLSHVADGPHVQAQVRGGLACGHPFVALSVWLAHTGYDRC